MSGTLENYIQNVKIGDTPIHKARTSEDDRLAILFCEILVWNATEKDWWTVPENACRITEVQSIEINKTYKKCIQTAKVIFPRGSVMTKGYGTNGIKDENGVKTGNKTKDETETNLIDATANGELLIQGSSLYVNGERRGEGTLSINAERADSGILNVSSGMEGMLTKNDLAPKQRIDIRLAYAYDDETFMQYKRGDIHPEPVFKGFITKCSVDSPLEISCEDMASIFKKVSCPNLVAKKNYTVNDFLADNGTFKLLQNSGIKLDPDTKNIKIDIGKVNLQDHLTVADVLDEWAKCGIFSFMNETDERQTLRVGWVYNSGGDYNKNGDLMGVPKAGMNVIQCDWDVANDGLKAFEVDKAFLAVNVIGRKTWNEFYKFTIRKKEKRDANDKEEFEVINRRKPKSLRGTKKKAQGGLSDNDPTGEHLSLSKYTVITFYCPTLGITEEELKKKAIAYYKKYNPNGLSGSLTLFGDRTIRPTDCIALIDPRHPERNGFYFVESVNTKFGTGGYRVEIKIPYKYGNFSKPVKIETLE